MARKSEGTAAVTGAALRRVSLFEALAQQIEEQILSGELPVGVRMPTEDALAVQFGVSRPVVREAMGRLRDRGLLDSRPRAGAFVTVPDDDYLHAAVTRHIRMGSAGLANVVEARTSIESTTAAFAAERATASEKQAIRACLDGMADSRADRERFTEQDMAFHMLIATASHNPLLAAMLEPFLDFIEENVSESHRRPKVMAAGMAGHESIWEAIAAGDPRAARGAMADHLAQGKRFMQEVKGTSTGAKRGG